ncbi:hypothetical protein D3C72_2077340 [compost metagenome]
MLMRVPFRIACTTLRPCGSLTAVLPTKEAYLLWRPVPFHWWQPLQSPANSRRPNESSCPPGNIALDDVAPFGCRLTALALSVAIGSILRRYFTSA